MENILFDFKEILIEFQIDANLKENSLFVVGCSTSEILGKKIGTSSNIDLANSLMSELIKWAFENDILLAIQGCEHINRSLVVEKETAELFNLEIVNVLPYKEAGGALSHAAMELFTEPVVVESLMHKAVGGIDIGDTFIGMHLKRVVVPIRLSKSTLGEAHMTFAKSRPMLIGGSRAKHY